MTAVSPADETIAAAPPPVARLASDDLAALAWKVTCLLVALQACQSTVMIGMLAFQAAKEALWYLPTLLVSAWFARFAYRQSLRHAVGPGASPTTTELDPAGMLALQRVAFSVIGVYLIATEVPVLASRLLHVARGGSEFESRMQVALLPDNVSSFMTALLGLLLFLGSRALSDLWVRARQYGVQPPRAPHGGTPR